MRRARVARHARAANGAAGSQTHRASLASTARPHALKKRRTPSGETTASNGAKNATPMPPSVIASRTPCDAVARNR